MRHDPPAVAGAMAPQLAPAVGGGVWLSWLERSGEGHRLRVARFDGEGWGDAVTVAAGDGFFVNWADVPSVVEAAPVDGRGGEMLAHWLAKTGGDTYAYGVFLARSTDGGATWRPIGTLHDDDTPAEHGFASLLPAPDGGFDAFWLDGRAMPGGGAMTVRAARVVDGEPRDATVLDDRVCECCQTSAARTAGGPLVVYRDRSEDEVRDVRAVRRTAAAEGGGAWSEPVPVAADDWKIAGCPVNGPAVAADGERVVVAWFTGAGGRPRVRAAISEDGGAHFGAPLEVDGAEPLGRVDVALLTGGLDAADDGAAAISWLGGDGGIRLRYLSPDGRLGAPRRVATTSTERASGFPRLAATDGSLQLAWTEPDPEGTDGHLRFATLPAAMLARP